MKPAVFLLMPVVLLAGCASPPAEQAVFGNPYPLMQLVESGGVGVNDHLLASNLPGDTKNVMTPLCALLNSAAASKTIDTLLERGADVNLPCRPDRKALPLDIAIAAAVNRGAMDPPYRASKQYRPQEVPVYIGYAEKLINRGARSESGSMTMVSVRERVDEGIRQNNEYAASQQDSYNRQVASNQALVSGAAVIAGAVVAAGVVNSAVKQSPSLASNATSALGQASSGANPGTAAKATEPQKKSNAGPQPGSAAVGGAASPSSTKGKAAVVTTPAPSAAANSSGANIAGRAAANESWKVCGPNSLCEAGDGYRQFCAGPPKPGAPRCKEGCEMSMGVFYHDTTLPKNAAYIPATEKCQPGCTAVNSCS